MNNALYTHEAASRIILQSKHPRLGNALQKNNAFRKIGKIAGFAAGVVLAVTGVLAQEKPLPEGIFKLNCPPGISQIEARTPESGELSSSNKQRRDQADEFGLQWKEADINVSNFIVTRRVSMDGHWLAIENQSSTDAVTVHAKHEGKFVFRQDGMETVIPVDFSLAGRLWAAGSALDYRSLENATECRVKYFYFENVPAELDSFNRYGDLEPYFREHADMRGIGSGVRQYGPWIYPGGLPRRMPTKWTVTTFGYYDRDGNRIEDDTIKGNFPGWGIAHITAVPLFDYQTDPQDSLYPGLQWYCEYLAPASRITYVDEANGAYGTETTYASWGRRDGYLDNGDINVTHSVFVGIEKMRYVFGIQEELFSAFVSPNPSGGFTTVYSNFQNPAALKIFDLSGNRVYGGNVQAGEVKTSLDLRGLSSGAYFATFEWEGQPTASRKIIITK